jgi:hypothetical protein
LHEVGIEAEAFEQASEVLELDVGVNMQPHPIKELAALGLLPSLDRTGIRTRRMIYMTRCGQTVWDELQGLEAGYDVPMVSIHRGTLQGVLYQAALDRLAATDASKPWLAEQAHALKHDGPDPVLAAVRALPPGEHRAAALAYLQPPLAQLQYPTFRAAGYPIGSGLVEGANKVVVQDRLKGSGMHWAPASVDPMLALRTVVCADRWDETWPQISTRLRADARARSRHLRAERQAARRDARAIAAPAPVAITSPTTPTPLIPKTIVDGHPTNAHPWNRRFLPHRPATPAEN